MKEEERNKLKEELRIRLGTIVEESVAIVTSMETLPTRESHKQRHLSLERGSQFVMTTYGDSLLAHYEGPDGQKYEINIMPIVR